MGEYTERDFERQDAVDATIVEFLCDISGKDFEWSLEDIANIRLIAEQIIVDKYEMMENEEFYP